MQGPVDYLTAIIYVSDILTQPDWWDQEFETAFLGPYSDIKYRTFIESTGVSDLSGMDVTEISAYVRMFIYYLREMDLAGTPVYESDGVTKVLSTINFSA